MTNSQVLWHNVVLEDSAMLQQNIAWYSTGVGDVQRSTPNSALA